MLAELCALARDGVARRSAAVVDDLNRSEKHDGILVQSPLPDAMGHDAERRVFDAVRAGQGRRRLSPDQRRPPGAEPRDARRVHAVGRHRDPGAVEYPHRRRPGRRHRPQRHRRQADGAAAAASARDRHHRAFARPRICRSSRPRPTSSWRRSAGPDSSRSRSCKPGATVIDVGINRLDSKAAVEKMFPGDAARLAAFEKRGVDHRRRRASGCRRRRRRVHAGPRRRRSADDCVVAEKHLEGGTSEDPLAAPRPCEPRPSEARRPSISESSRRGWGPAAIRKSVRC